MRVLISGGGIAGLTLAYFLNQHGLTPVVIERASGPRQEGYAIDFFGVGYEVAERMRLLDRLAREQIPFEALTYVNAQGKVIARLNMALLQQITNGKYLGLMHGTLEAALYEALNDQVEVRFGRELLRVAQGTDAVEVPLSDGRTEAFDLLIGADGVHSGTRALVLGPEEDFRCALGCTIACYPLADRYRIGRAWSMYLEPGRLVAALCTPQADEILAFFVYRSAAPEHLPREQRLARLRDVFEGMGWLTQSFLSDVNPAENIFMDAAIRIQMPIWHRGRVALLGDACDCPTPLSGHGASLAMAGAYLLAVALREATTYQEAFQRYEQQLRPYAQAQQRHARHFGAFFLPGTLLGVLVQQALVRALFRERFRGLLRREFSAPSLAQLCATTAGADRRQEVYVRNTLESNERKNR
jgi:2-polyprenyl-6-methoxyphenol hydroxylase-like FAD-dependent oxidoreductase